MKAVSASIKKENEYLGIIKELKSQLRMNKRPILVNGLSGGSRAVFISSLYEDRKSIRKDDTSCALILASDEKEALKLNNVLTELGNKSAVYQSRDFMFHNIVSSHEYEYERINILASILNNSIDFVITTPDALLQYTIPKNILIENTLTLEYGSSYDLESLCRYLERIGYSRAETVDGIGQYSIRGGIIDIFSPSNPNPYRMEFFGDDIDTMSIFDVISQRKIDNIQELKIVPVREVIFTDDDISTLYEIINAQKKKAKKAEVIKALASELEAIDAKVELNFIDKYIYAIYQKPSCLLDYFKDGATISNLFFVNNPNGVKEKIAAVEMMEAQNMTVLIENGEIAPKYAQYYKKSAFLEAAIMQSSAVVCDTFLSGGEYAQIFSFNTKSALTYSDKFDVLCDDLSHYIKNKYNCVLLCENDVTAKNVQQHLADANISASIIAEKDNDTFECDSYEGCVFIASSFNIEGFVLERTKFVCISLYINQGSYSKVIASKTRRFGKKGTSKERIMSYADLEEGDYVVHDTCGIGIYLGMKNLTDYEGISKDYLHIRYADNASLYVPCDRLEVLTKYIGPKAGEGSVKLSKMGGAEWGRAKAKVKSAAKDMAKELIELYARRKRQAGIAFLPDDDMQRQFESAFEYEETEGQLEAVRDIKNDMEDSTPMDRLLCGDVGFGKTEVALRAAFKAVMSGKQVALLVPTTILALQHYQTFLARMRGYPVNIEMLSRFRNSKEQSEIIRKIKRGDADIIIGTHRIVSKDIEFKNLGLIIIDEEQRFGVAHKEKLKQIAANADVLTLTATPIPRTLNMAISGIRDMSILDEAPGDRMPPQTYVLEYDDIIIAEAIKKELRRGGQVFYLHNSIDDINSIANKIAKMVPDCVIATAHGKMDKEEISDIWRSLVTGEIDILVSTTIIEAGIDIPNANTLIIENADKMGLSQLHQIRGRIGRSSRRSYAFLTYKKGKALTEIAAKRLNALREYTEFGSGFKIALRDLEIRGAGNLLGDKQHGHIDSVGYDMYVKLLNEAVLEETGKTVEKKTECTVNLSYSAYIPDSYISSMTQRIDIYKKISHIENRVDLDDIADELLDRFGDLPQTVEYLLNISLVRAYGQAAHIKRIDQDKKVVTLVAEDFDFQLWADISEKFDKRLSISLAAKQPTVIYKIKAGDNPIYMLQDILEAAAEKIKNDKK